MATSAPEPDWYANMPLLDGENSTTSLPICERV